MLIRIRTSSGFRRQKGYMLVMFTLSMLLLLGVSGLAIDVGRMYLNKSATQSFADAAALNAALKIAQSPGDFTAITAAATSTNKKWEFDSKSFVNITTSYSTSPTGTFTTSPPGLGVSPSDYKYVRVRADINVPMYLMGAALGKSASSVAAQAMAGVQALTSVPGGEFPYSPWSRKNHNPEDANDPFGFKAGNQYTLRWKPPGNKSTCGTDEGSGVGNNQDFRGYCCTGGSSAVGVYDIMAGGGTVPVATGDPFPPLWVQGQKETIVLADFINADSDTSAPNYNAYRANNKGNNKRIVIVPVNNDMQTVVGFAAFFLLTANKYNGQDFCGEYIGSFVQNAPVILPGGGSGVYRLQLFE